LVDQDLLLGTHPAVHDQQSNGNSYSQAYASGWLCCLVPDANTQNKKSCRMQDILKATLGVPMQECTGPHAQAGRNSKAV
jgi:hypothetical protein